MHFRDRSLAVWALCCVLAGALFLVYVSASLAAGRGEIVMPLDDVYIHFQYARQMASGQPYVYNPGEPPTSGATSFIYPYILAVGYLLGFQGLNLGLWAMIVGALALAGSLWLVYRLSLAFDAPHWLAIITALIFGLTGAVNWHFFSGMETGLMTLFTLATLFAFVTGRLRLFVLAASLLALTRPEGGALAVIAAVVMLVKERRWWLLLPALVLFVQPLVNLLVTGSAVATGNSAKSILGMVPFYWDVVIGRIIENFARMWTEFFTGVSPREGLYIPYGVGPLALIALIVSLIRRDRWPVSGMVVLWLLAGTAAIATLDTAFWHFKRYQMPLMALFYPLAAWGVVLILRATVQAQREHVGKMVAAVVIAVGVLLIALTTSAAFVRHFALNVNYVYLQPLQMAHWLNENTPEDALIAVHDVGMMRYMGGRNTLDMVGLTTPGAAAYWRNGPGSIAEFLIQERPDYIASYGEGHGLGLGMIAQTSIYGDPLAEYPVVLDDHYNVALAADTQGIYQPEWAYLTPDFADSFPSSYVLNVANLDSETAFNYQWKNNDRLAGFPTDLVEVPRLHCNQVPCVDVIAGRRLNGSEAFILQVDPHSQGVVLVSVFHAAHRGTFDIYVNEEYFDRNWIPQAPGQIIWAATYIPAELFDDDRIVIRIDANVLDGFYMPLLHILNQTELRDIGRSDDAPVATYQNGAIELPEFKMSIDDRGLVLELFWYSNGDAEGDYRFFVHLYDDINQPPVAQYDDYSGSGTLPPGNWLPGVRTDEAVVDLNDTPPGTYQLAIGFYDPYTGERLMPESEVYEVSNDGRLWLGEVEVPG